MNIQMRKNDKYKKTVEELWPKKSIHGHDHKTHHERHKIFEKFENGELDSQIEDMKKKNSK